MAYPWSWAIASPDASARAAIRHIEVRDGAPRAPVLMIWARHPHLRESVGAVSGRWTGACLSEQIQGEHFGVGYRLSKKSWRVLPWRGAPSILCGSSGPDRFSGERRRPPWRESTLRMQPGFTPGRDERVRCGLLLLLGSLLLRLLGCLRGFSFLRHRCNHLLSVQKCTRSLGAVQRNFANLEKFFFAGRRRASDVRRPDPRAARCSAARSAIILAPAFAICGSIARGAAVPLMLRRRRFLRTMERRALAACRSRIGRRAVCRKRVRRAAPLRRGARKTMGKRLRKCPGDVSAGVLRGEETGAESRPATPARV